MARFRPRRRRTNSDRSLTSRSKAATRRSRFRRLFPRLLPFEAWRNSRAVERLVAWFKAPALSRSFVTTNYVGRSFGGLRLEALDERVLLAVDTIQTDVPAAGDLTITTDNAADTYTLQLTADNMVEVTDGGGSEGTFGVTGTLFFVGGTAADNVTLDLNGFTLSAAFDFSTGDDADEVTITDNAGGGLLDSDVTGDLGAGNDDLNIESVDVSGSVSVAGGAGDNDFYIGQAPFGNGNATYGDDVSIGGGLTITGGDDGNRVEIDDATITGDVTMTGGAGVDDLYLDRSSISGNIGFNAGDGNNTLYIEYGVVVGGNITMTAGAGGDEASLDDDVDVTGNVTFNLGDGANRVDTNEVVTIGGNLTVNTGTDADTIDVTDTAITGDVTISAGEGSNTVYLENLLGDGGTTFGGNTSVTAGTGNDTLSINASGEGFGFAGNLSIDLGDGTNSISSGDIVFDTGSTYTVIIDADPDEIDVTGTVTINGATLNLTGPGLPSVGDSAIIIDNDGADAVVGTFAGMGEGQAFIFAGGLYQISYVGGDGNDVALTRLTAGVYEFAMPATSAGEAGVGMGQTVPQLMVLGDFSNITNPADRTVNLVPTIFGTATLNADYALTSFIIPQVNFTTPTMFDLTTTNVPNAGPSFTVDSDLIVEGNETIEIGASDSSALIEPGDVDGVDGTEVLDIHTVVDDDTATLDIEAAKSVDEEGGAQTLDVTLTITGTGTGMAALGHATTITADVTDAGSGSATSGTDYTAFGTQTVTFGPNTASGATDQVTIEPLTDQEVEGDETVDLSLENLQVSMGNAVPPGTVDAALGNTASVVTILDDDQLEVEFQDASTSDDEAVSANLPMLLVSGTSAIDQTIDVVVTSTDAEASDFTNVVAVTIPAGSYTMTALPIDLTIHDDTIVEPDEVINLMLQNPSAGVAIADVDGADGVEDTTSHTILNDDSTTVTIEDASGDEGDVAGDDTVLSFLVWMSNEVEGGLSLTVETSDDTAVAGSDYVSNSQMLTLTGAGMGAGQNFDVEVIEELLVEGDETFTVAVTSSSATDIDASFIDDTDTGTGTIVNDDSATLTVDDVSMAEGDSGTTIFTFTVTLDNAVQGGFDVDVDTADDTATDADDDYEPASDTLSFAGTAGEGHTFEVTVNGDTKIESDEAFQVLLSNVQPNDLLVDSADIDATATGTGTIENDDQANLSITNVTLAENADGGGTTVFQFKLTLDSDTGDSFDVDYTIMPVGLAPATIATDLSSAATGTVSFAGTANEMQFIDVDVVNDNIVEADEGFEVVLTGLTNTSLNSGDVVLGGPGQGVILNDDMATVTIADVTDAEGTGAGNNPFPFALSVDNPVQGGFEVFFAVNDGTATDADDFDVVTTVPVAFAGTAGEMGSILVDVHQDSVAEANETFTVDLNGVTALGLGVDPANIIFSGTPATGTIENDDGPVITINDVTMLEGTGGGPTQYIFDVTLNATVQDPDGFTVDFAVNDGTATDADDFDVMTTTPLTFTGDGTATLPQTHQIRVDVLHDSKVERDETFNVSLDSVTGDDTGGQITLDTPAVAVILNDDTTTVSITPPEDTFEGDSGATPFVFTVSLTNPVQGPFNLDFTAAHVDTDASDFASAFPTSPLAIPDGATSATITVDVQGDLDAEPNEDFEITLDGASGLGVGIDPADVVIDTAPAVATILNDDNPVITADNPMIVEGDSGSQVLTFTVTYTGRDTGTPFTVDVAAVSGTATSGVDFGAASASQLMFDGVADGSAGDTQTVTVPVNGDTLVEGDETFTLDLSNVQGTVAPVTLNDGTGLIQDDDALLVEFTTDMTMSDENAAVQTLPQLVVKGMSERPFTVDVVPQASSTATLGTDYTNSPQAVTIPAGNYDGVSMASMFPTNIAISPDTTVEFDETIDLLLTSSTPQVVIGDADMSGGTQDAAQHVIKNDDGATASATVNGQSSVTINEGGTVTLEGMINNVAEQHVVTINWGDGSSSSITIDPNQFSSGKANFSINHTYLDDVPTVSPSDTYSVAISISPASGQTFQVTPSPQVTVNNVAPVFTSLNVSPTSGNIGQQVTVSGTYSDPGVLDTFQLLIDTNNDGIFDITTPVTGGNIPTQVFNANQATSAFRFRITDDDSGVQTQIVPVNFQGPAPPQTAVQNSQVFYNNSAFDGGDVAANAADLNAVDTSKTSLGIGQTATFANITGARDGITGVKFTVNNLPNDGAGLSPADFQILLGTTNNINGWVAGPSPTVTVLPNAGAGGADCVLLTFAAGTIADTYAAFQMLATANTGLASTHTAIFGNVRGDTGAAFVGQGQFFGRDASDLQAMVPALFQSAGVTSATDVTKDGTTNAFDLQVIPVQSTAAIGGAFQSNVIPVITPGFSAAPAPGFALAAVDEAVAVDDDADAIVDGNGMVASSQDGRVGSTEEDDRDLAFATFGDTDDAGSDLIGALAGDRMSL